MLFTQLIYPAVLHVAMHQPTAKLHLSVYKPQTTHYTLNRSDEGLNARNIRFEISSNLHQQQS